MRINWEAMAKCADSSLTGNVLYAASMGTDSAQINFPQFFLKESDKVCLLDKNNFLLNCQKAYYVREIMAVINNNKLFYCFFYLRGICIDSRQGLPIYTGQNGAFIKSVDMPGNLIDCYGLKWLLAWCLYVDKGAYQEQNFLIVPSEIFIFQFYYCEP